MSYLYGDSTPSTLDINFIEFLRQAVDFCVSVVEADQRIAEGAARTRKLDEEAVVEIDRLKKVAALVPHAFDSVPVGHVDSASTRCVATIVRSTLDLVRLETSALHSALDADIAKRDAEAGRERETCLKALEKLLLAHILPDTKVDMRVGLVDGVRYGGRAQLTTSFGLVAAVDLSLPEGHLFERVVRVDRVTERLDIQAPEVAGWLHKEVKMRPQHLERHHVTDLTITSGGAGTLKLRVGADGSGPGFNLTFSREAPRVQVARVDHGDGPADPPFAAEEADARKLLGLYEKLASSAAELTKHRRALADAKLDGEPLRTIAKPTLVVERLIASIAPVVQEIAARSQSPGELVLRRLLGDGRREEIFLSKSELKAKVDTLAASNRPLFDPLWVEHPSAAPASPAARLDRLVPSMGPLPSVSLGSLSPATRVTLNYAASSPATETPPRPRPPSPTPARGTTVSAPATETPPRPRPPTPARGTTVAPPPPPSPPAAPAAKPPTPPGDAPRPSGVPESSPAAKSGTIEVSHGKH
jgi:hypothetical protein